MRIIEKTENGFIVFVDNYEMGNLSRGTDRWNYKDKIGKEVPITSLSEAISMAENIAYKRRSILSSIDDLKNLVERLPVDQFSNTTK
jgi:hypothetical protein